MPNLSIKNAPEALVQQLREQAAANHRSLQGELMSIIEKGVRPRRLDPRELLAELRRHGVQSADNSVEIIRADRDRDDRK